MSKCWDEFNFVRTAGEEYSPIIFNDFKTEGSESCLIYSQDLKILFDPNEMGMNKSGFLYQKIKMNDLDYGMFSSELTVRLYEHLQVYSNSFTFLSILFLNR